MSSGQAHYRKHKVLICGEFDKLEITRIFSVTPRVLIKQPVLAGKTGFTDEQFLTTTRTAAPPTFAWSPELEGTRLNI